MVTARVGTARMSATKSNMISGVDHRGRNESTESKKSWRLDWGHLFENRRNKEKGVTGIKDEEEGLCPGLRHSTGLEVKSRSECRLLCLERPGHFYIYPQQ